MSRCGNCGKEIYLDKRFTYCSKSCNRVVKLKKKREYTKKYYLKNREKIIEKARQYEKSDQRKKTYEKYRGTYKYILYSRKRYHDLPENIRKARYTVVNAIRDGKIHRPKICEKCGREDWGEKRSMIEAHHYKGYSPEYWLTIQWLCTNCHKEVG